MAGFGQDFIEAVRNSGDIVQLVSDYVPLRPSGSRMKGLCPFHEEKTPSFSVDPQRQLFYCFGCQTGGDLFKFVQLYEKLSFPEAAELLARRFGVPIPQSAGRSASPVDRLLQLNNTADAWFRAMLAEHGTDCRAYLKRRRIDDRTAERLAVGYAPPGWEGLRSHLLTKRFRVEEQLTAGLILPRKSGSGHYDRFRNRLIFPIRDLRGRTVAFGGRALGDDTPKYINSPETPAYKKGEHLYGLDLATEAIRKEGQAIVVEGYLDLAALVQAGFPNVVASLGTAFTEAQARLLARFTNRIVFSYDGDAAGGAATVRSLDLLLAKGLEVHVVELPGGADPDDFIGREGAEAYGQRVSDAPEYLEFLIRRETRERDLSRVPEQVAAVQAVLPHLTRLSSAVARSAWSARLADALNIQQEWVLQELRSAVRRARPQIRQRPTPPGRQPISSEAEAHLVTGLLRSPEQRAHTAETLDPSELDGARVQPIVRTILSLENEGRTVDYPTVVEALEDEDDRALLTELAFRDEPESAPSVEDCLWSFKRARIAREGREVRREIDQLQKSARGAASPSEIDQQLIRLQRLARERDALS